MSSVFSGFNDSVGDFIEGLNNIDTASVMRFGHDRMREAAQRLSHVGEAAKCAAICNEAAIRMIADLYEPDTDGQRINHDPLTGRFNIPAPWGSRGKRYFGVRRREADTLRAYLMHLNKLRRPVPLFYYSKDGNGWYLNFDDYKTEMDAVKYWEMMQMTVHTWKKFHGIIKNGIVFDPIGRP